MSAAERSASIVAVVRVVPCPAPKKDKNPDLIAPCSKIKLESIYTTGGVALVPSLSVSIIVREQLFKGKKRKASRQGIYFLAASAAFFSSAA